MTNVLVSTIPTFAGLSAATEAAAGAFNADAVPAGAPFLARCPFGVVAIDDKLAARMVDTVRDYAVGV